MEIRNRIRYFRKIIKKMTQEEFSKQINVSRSNLGNIEIGRISVTDRVISDICSCFNISEKWLRYGTKPMLQETESSIFQTFSKRYNLSPSEQITAKYLLDLSSDERQAVIKHIMNIADAIKSSQSNQNGNVPTLPLPLTEEEKQEAKRKALHNQLDAEKKGQSASHYGNSDTKKNA